MIPGLRHGVWSAGRLVVLLAALSGLFAMHGMSDHGTTSHGAMESHASGGAGTHGHVTDAADGIMTSVNALEGITTSALSNPMVNDADGGDAHAAMELCLVILAGAVFLALRRAGLPSYPLTAVRSTDVAKQPLPSRYRAPDPPDLHVLSIQRC
jgi:hypothetical protein